MLPRAKRRTAAQDPSESTPGKGNKLANIARLLENAMDANELRDSETARPDFGPGIRSCGPALRI
jgi:hypothetical protein